MIEIVVNNVWCRILNFKNIQLVDLLDKQTSFYVEGYQYTKAFRDGYFDKRRGTFVHWDGKKHLLTNNLTFPTGLLQRVEEFLQRHKQEYKILDQRNIPKTNKPIKIKGHKPRDYQQKALKAVIKHERGMIRMATGSGKTFLAAMITAHYNVPTMIYVIGKDLLYQFHKEMEKALGIKVGIIGDGKCEIEKINICSIWTAITSFGLTQPISLDDEDWKPEIKIVDTEQKKQIKKAIENSILNIYDEAHFLATDTIQSIYKAAKKCRYLIACSGSPWRDDGADLLIESICGKRIYNLSASELIERKYLTPVNIKMIEVPSLEKSLPKNYPSVYSKYISNNEIRNKIIVDSCRILIKKGRKVLILVRYISHGKELAKQLNDISLFFVNGEIDAETRNSVKQDFEEGNLDCIIASSVFDIGVDIPSLDALILAGGGKSTTRTLQRIGRVIRLHKNKKNAVVVDFIDNARYLDKHSAIRVAVYNTEPMFNVILPKDFNIEDYLKSSSLNKLIKKVS